MLDPAQPFIQSNEKVGLFYKKITVNQNTDIVQQAAPARHGALSEIILFNLIKYDNKSYNIL